MKKIKQVTVIVSVLMLLITNVYQVWSYPKDFFEVMPQTKVHLYSTQVLKDVFEKTYYEQSWVSVREAFSEITKNVSWDSDNNIAYITNNGRSLVLNFSDQDLSADDNYLLVPDEYKKYTEGTAYLDPKWLFKLFEETETIYCFNNYFAENWFKDFNKVVKNEREIEYGEYNWVPIRDVFGKFMDIISWNSSKKIAYITNNNQELVFNFSGEAVELQDNQFLVPDDHMRLIDGTTHINIYWIAWIFDIHEYEDYSDKDLAARWFTPEREELRQSLYFLDIVEMSYIYDMRSNIFNIFIKFKGGVNY